MIQNKVLLAAIFLLLSYSAPAVAETVKDGVTAFAAGDYVNALRILRPLADQGDAGAQYFIGSMYEKGDGVPKDNAEAMKWYLKSADQGDVGSQFAIGAIYDTGNGATQDYKEAAKWFKKAADQGYVLGQFMMGEMYAGGLGVTHNYVEAAKQYLKAAEQGNPEAACRLAYFYANAQGVPLNYSEAKKWNDLALNNLSASSSLLPLAQETQGQIASRRGPAAQDLFEWDKAAQKTLSQIQAMPSGPMQRAMLEDMKEQRANRELEASMEENIARETSPSSLTTGNYSNTLMQEKSDEADFKLHEIEQKQQELEKRQIEMNSKIEADEIFNGR